MKTVLVVGASGIVGGAAVRSFLDDDSWNIVTLSRRTPAEFADTLVRHAAADLFDADGLRTALEPDADITPVVHAAAFEKPGLIPGWTDPEQIEGNALMFSNVFHALDGIGAPSSTCRHSRGRRPTPCTSATGCACRRRSRSPAPSTRTSTSCRRTS